MRITGEQARKLHKHGALLLDVRTPEEFASGHIPGAVNFPIKELLENPEPLEEMVRVGDMKRTVVVYCHHGLRSLLAVEKLETIGYAVYDMGAMSKY